MRPRKFFNDCLMSMIGLPETFGKAVQSPIKLELDYEIDQDTLDEGWKITIPTSIISENIETDDGQHPSAIELFMKVKYDVFGPESLTFYDDEYETKISSYKLNDDFRKFFGIKQTFTDNEFAIDVVDEIVIVFFEELMKAVMYATIEHMN